MRNLNTALLSLCCSSVVVLCSPWVRQDPGVLRLRDSQGRVRITLDATAEAGPRVVLHQATGEMAVSVSVEEGRNEGGYFLRMFHAHEQPALELSHRTNQTHGSGEALRFLGEDGRRQLALEIDPLYPFPSLKMESGDVSSPSSINLGLRGRGLEPTLIMTASRDPAGEQELPPVLRPGTPIPSIELRRGEALGVFRLPQRVSEPAIEIRGTDGAAYLKLPKE